MFRSACNSLSGSVGFYDLFIRADERLQTTYVHEHLRCALEPFAGKAG